MKSEEFLETLRKYREYDYTLEEMRTGKVPDDMNIAVDADGVYLNGEKVEDE